MVKKEFEKKIPEFHFSWGKQKAINLLDVLLYFEFLALKNYGRNNKNNVINLSSFFQTFKWKIWR